MPEKEDSDRQQFAGELVSTPTPEDALSFYNTLFDFAQRAKEEQTMITGFFTGAQLANISQRKQAIYMVRALDSSAAINERYIERGIPQPVIERGGVIITTYPVSSRVTLGNIHLPPPSREKSSELIAIDDTGYLTSFLRKSPAAIWQHPTRPLRGDDNDIQLLRRIHVGSVLALELYSKFGSYETFANLLYAYAPDAVLMAGIDNFDSDGYSLYYNKLKSLISQLQAINLHIFPGKISSDTGQYFSEKKHSIETHYLTFRNIIVHLDRQIQLDQPDTTLLE